MIHIRSAEIDHLTASPIAIMELQAKALFRHDADGRLLSINVPSRYPAPRVFVGRTLAGNLSRFRFDLPSPLVERLTALIASEPNARQENELERTPRFLPEMIELLTERAPIEETWHGPAWTFPESVGPAGTPATKVDDSNTSVLERWFPWLVEELDDSWPCFAIIDGADAVAVCRSVRTTAQAVEAGVETVEAYRGRGYASSVVHTWAAAVRSYGLVPLYSTSWDNLASRGVARRLGLSLFGADLHIT